MLTCKSQKKLEVQIVNYYIQNVIDAYYIELTKQ